MRVSSLHVYPLKSAGGIRVPRFELDRFGPRLDRRWMLVDGRGDFVSQRSHPRMALLSVSLSGSGIRVSSRDSGFVDLPFRDEGVDSEGWLEVRVWESSTSAQVVAGEASAWFSEFLGEPARLLFLPRNRERSSSDAFIPSRPISFADGYPMLVISMASLDELNRRLPSPVAMDRFRPNVVVEGCGPHAEDRWREVRMGDVRFKGVKPCPRCVVTTVDQVTAVRGREPLRTLSAYRTADGHVWFGQNLCHLGTGTLMEGDAVEVLEEGPPPVGPIHAIAETNPRGEE